MTEKCTNVLCFVPPAPSIVPIMHQISSTMNSFTLSWPQPEQPNGIILDYELRYYEKVRSEHESFHMHILHPKASEKFQLSDICERSPLG